MNKLSQNFAALAAACAIVLATWVPVVTVPVDHTAPTAATSTQITLPHFA